MDTFIVSEPWTTANVHTELSCWLSFLPEDGVNPQIKCTKEMWKAIRFVADSIGISWTEWVDGGVHAELSVWMPGKMESDSIFLQNVTSPSSDLLTTHFHQPIQIMRYIKLRCPDCACEFLVSQESIDDSNVAVCASCGLQAATSPILEDQAADDKFDTIEVELPWYYQGTPIRSE